MKASMACSHLTFLHEEATDLDIVTLMVVATVSEEPVVNNIMDVKLIQ
jgi:hypothetical protein